LVAAGAVLVVFTLTRARRAAIVAARLRPAMCARHDWFKTSARAMTNAHAWGGGRNDALRDLISVVESVGSATRSGASLHQALVSTSASAPASLRAPLRDVVARAGHGQPLAASLRIWASNDRTAAPVARALALAHELGGHAPRVTDALADSLRERRAVASEVRALSAQARASATILVIAPYVVAALLALLDPQTAAFLLGSPLGLGCIAGGVVLDSAGALWMARLCRVRS
jgi:tight adherence protein B